MSPSAISGVGVETVAHLTHNGGVGHAPRARQKLRV
jgi:hypothetical protein